MDGSGKTTVIEAMQRDLNKEGFKTITRWMRFNHILTKPVHGFCGIVGLARKHKTSTGYYWRHEFYRSKSFCYLYIILTYIDSWLGKSILFWIVNKSKPDFIICDRWINDIIIDLAVKCRNENFLMSNWCSRFYRLQPQNVKQFILVRNNTKLLNCRNENQEDPDFHYRVRLYKKLPELEKEIFVIDNNGSIKCTVSKIMSLLI